MVKNPRAAQCAELDLEVVPGSKKFGLLGFNPWTGALKVKVRASPLKGRANAELKEEFERLFKGEVAIVSGEKSRKKKILIKGISKPQTNQIISEAENT